MPVGSSNDGELPSRTSPTIAKTFIKGIVAIAVFSLFLEINPATIVNYLIFLALSIGLLGVFVMFKRRTVFEFGDDFLIVKRFLSKPKYIRYDDVDGTSLSQGFLAKRMNCGSVFLILKKGSGNSKIVGGGSAERLEDIPQPQRIRDYFSRAGSF